MALYLAHLLPAGQLTVRSEDSALALSKAEIGRFDCLVISQEKADTKDLSVLLDDGRVAVVRR